MSVQAKALVDAVVHALESLENFSYETYVQGVKSLLGVDNNTWNQACQAPVYGEDPGGDPALINRFKVETIALGVSRTSGYGFSDTVVKDTLNDKITATASSVVVPIYRRYLEDHLASAGSANDLLKTISDPDFCHAFVQKVLDPPFINDALIARYFGQSQYTQAIAYIYERARATLISSPSSEAMMVSTPDAQLAASTIVRSSLSETATFLNVVNANQKLAQANGTQAFLALMLPITWSNNTLLQGPSFPDIGSQWSASWVADTYATDVANALIQVQTTENESSGMSIGPGGDPAPQPFIVKYGDSLWQWIVAQQNSGFGDIFQVHGTENSKEEVPSIFSGGGCFSPGTMIETSAGARPIHSLHAGDRVLTCAPSNFGILSSEKVVHDISPIVQANVELHMPLYGFNGEEPFVSAGHVFFTVLGPKAIAPAMAVQDNPEINVGMLQRGDILLRLKGDRSGYEHITIKTIASTAATCSTIHGLHFPRGGDGGRYHANGYWVAENYPDITIQCLLSRYQELNPHERTSFVRSIRRLPRTFRQVFGSAVFDVFQKSFSNVSGAMALATEPKTLLQKVEHVAKNHVSATALKASFRLVHAQRLNAGRNALVSTHGDYAKRVKAINGDSDLPIITLAGGAVLSDGNLVKHASVSPLGVQWSHELPGKNGIFQHGALRLIGHGRAVAGVVGVGPATVPSVEDLQVTHNFIALADANDYSLVTSPQISTSIANAEALSPDGLINWPAFWKVEIGLSMQDGGLTVTLTMPELDTEFRRQHPNSIDLPSLYSVSPANYNPQNNVVLIPVRATPGFESFLQDCVTNWGSPATKGPAFNTFAVLLNLESNGVHGYYNELSQDVSSNYTDGPLHALYSSSSSSLSAMHEAVTSAVIEAPVQQKLVKPATVHDVASNFHEIALPASKTLANTLFAANNLSVAELQTMPAPSETDLNSLSQTYMQNSARYWRAQPEVDVFGDEKSAVIGTGIPDTLTANIDSSNVPFLGSYSRAMIIQSLSTNSTYTGRFSDGDHKNLSYYWQGSQTGCVSQDPAFTRVSKIAGGAAFVAQTPTLHPYTQDSQDWAQKFYVFLTTDTQLNNQALGMFFNSTDNLTNRHCMVLNAIDQQNRQLDVALWKAVRDKLLVRSSTGTVTDDTNEFPPFATDFTTQLILNIQSGAAPTDLTVELQKDLQQLQTTFDTEEASELAGKLFGDQSELGRCLQQALKSMGGVVSKGGQGNFAKTIQNFSDNVAKNFPTLSKVVPYATSFCAIAMQGYSIFSSVRLLMNWSNLSGQDKTNAIITIVNATANICKEVAEIIQRMRGLDPKSFDFQVQCVKWNQATGQEAPKVTDQEEKPDGSVSVSSNLDEKQIAAVNSVEAEAPVEEQMGAAVNDVELAGKVEKTFGLGEVACAGFAVAANIASAVCLGFQIANDFETGQPPGIKAMDIITEAATVAQVVCGVLEIGFAISGVTCAALPIVGAVVALIGVVMMFVELFVPHNPPEDPVNSYLDGQKDGFINTIPAPPHPELTYAVSPTSFDLSKSGTLTVAVTDPNLTNVLINSITLRLSASDGDSALFAAPSGADASGNPTTNIVSYSVGGGRTDFKIAGAKFAGTADGVLTARITSIGTGGTAIGEEGLTIQISGFVNGSAGTSDIKITEDAASRPDDIIAADVYTDVKVTKA